MSVSFLAGHCPYRKSTVCVGSFEGDFIAVVVIDMAATSAAPLCFQQGGTAVHGAAGGEYIIAQQNPHAFQRYRSSRKLFHIFMAFGGGERCAALAGAVVVQYVLPVGIRVTAAISLANAAAGLQQRFRCFPQLHGYRNSQVIAGQHHHLRRSAVPARSRRICRVRGLPRTSWTAHRHGRLRCILSESRHGHRTDLCRRSSPAAAFRKGTKCVCRFRGHFLPAGFAEILPPRNRTVTAGAAIGIEQIQQKHLHFSAGGYGNGHEFTSGRALYRVAFRVTFYSIPY